jgi:hypothetical protein
MLSRVRSGNLVPGACRQARTYLTGLLALNTASGLQAAREESQRRLGFRDKYDETLACKRILELSCSPVSAMLVHQAANQMNHGILCSMA